MLVRCKKGRKLTPMKRCPHPLVWILPLLCLGLPLTGFAQSETPEVREFRAKSGSRLKAMIVGMDPSGKVLLQRYAPNAVPLNSLSEEDQAYIKEWQERHEKEKAWIREGARSETYKDLGLSILKDTLRTLDGDKWKVYEPKNPNNIQMVAYYFNKEHPEDGFVDDLSKSYEKMRERSDVVEVVYITLGTSDQAVRDYVKAKEFVFPVLNPASIGLVNNSIVANLFKGQYPQLVVVDRKGKTLIDSFRGKNEEPQLLDTLEQLEKMVRKAARTKPAP